MVTTHLVTVSETFFSLSPLPAVLHLLLSLLLVLLQLVHMSSEVDLLQSLLLGNCQGHPLAAMVMCI